MKDDMPIHQKFGYQHMIEMQAIEKRLLDEGFVGNQGELFFAKVNAYQENHKNDLTLAQRQALKPVKKNEYPHFTNEELSYIMERLAGVNDPIGLTAKEKIEKYFLSLETEEMQNDS